MTLDELAIYIPSLTNQHRLASSLERRPYAQKKYETSWDVNTDVGGNLVALDDLGAICSSRALHVEVVGAFWQTRIARHHAGQCDFRRRDPLILWSVCCVSNEYIQTYVELLGAASTHTAALPLARQAVMAR